MIDSRRGVLLFSELCLVKIVHCESKWYSHNRLRSGSLVRNSFFWLNESTCLRRMLHWYIYMFKSSTSVTVFLKDCEKTDDRHLHVLNPVPFKFCKNSSLLGLLQKMRRLTENTKKTKLSESNFETRNCCIHVMCDSVCTSVVSRECDGFKISLT